MSLFLRIKRSNFCDSKKYRVIALSSVIGKTIEWVILIKECHVLTSYNLQFGFKNCLSTTHSIFCMNETINYYNYNTSNVYVVFLDATMVFVRVKYCKLFNQLCKRKMSPLVTRMLLFMYINQ